MDDLTHAAGSVVPSIVTGWFTKTMWVRADYYIDLQQKLIEANNRLMRFEAERNAASAEAGTK